MEIENSLFNVLEQVLVDFEPIYATTGSLHEIIHLLTLLPIEEQQKYDEQINMIKKTISEYGTEDKRLTDKQSDKFFRLIKSFSITFRPDKNISSWEILPKNYSKCTNNIESIDNGIDEDFSELHASGLGPSLSLEYKLNFDDEIWSVVKSLLDNLSRDTLSSSLGEYVHDYFSVVNYIVDENPYNKWYKEISLDIIKCLESHSWILQSDTTAGGFYTQPDRLKLVKDIGDIISKYF